MSTTQTLDKTRALAARLDVKANALMGYESNMLTGWLGTLLSGYMSSGGVEVGFRESCSKTDGSAKIFREWEKVVASLRREGVVVTAEPVKHKNAYAGNNGGFWKSFIYRIEEGTP